MHGSLAESRVLVSALREGVDDTSDPEMLLCPPFVYLQAVGEWLGTSPIRLGGQNLAQAPEPGAFTGEVSGAMLKDLGCSHVIVGHSERRALYGEGDAHVAAKFAAAQGHGLVPILCVGETLEEREADRTAAVVSRQVEAVLETAGAAAFGAAVVAYEPVWAIGTGKVATPEQAQEVHAFIRSRVAEVHGQDVADTVRILYGGSVKPDNVKGLMALPDVDGALVGGASLKAESFVKLVNFDEQ